MSGPTVQAMAEGARRAFEVDVAVAESGIASPLDPPRPGPAGRALLLRDRGRGVARVERYEFVGNRSATKKQAAEAALRLVLDYLDGLEGLEAGAG